MPFFYLNAASTILIEDDYDKNILPLILHLVNSVKDATVKIINYEQTASVWQTVFDGIPHQCINGAPKSYMPISYKSVYVIYSVNQMTLDMEWENCLRFIKLLQRDRNVMKIILILHKDSILSNSMIPVHLSHISNAIITCDEKDCQKLHIQIKKFGRIIRSEEIMTYDSTNRIITLKPVPKIDIEEYANKILPSAFATFKIETEQTQQLEKHKLKLPYMSKINEGKGKVYYEPDAVDDWDEEDPDDDLDI